MITNISTQKDITKIGDYIFRVCYTNVFQSQVMAIFARKNLQAEKAVVFKDLTSDYSLGVASEFKRKFSENGGEILIEIPYKHRQENFSEQVKLAAEAKPDVVFFTGHDESALLIREMVRIGLKATPIGCDGFGSDSFFRMGGNMIKTGYYCTHWAEDVQTLSSQSFVKRYKKGTANIYPTEALAYDAVMLMADAITRAGSTNRLKIRNALKETKGYQGVTGEISFNETGDPEKIAVIMKISDGIPHYLMCIDPKFTNDYN